MCYVTVNGKMAVFISKRDATCDFPPSLAFNFPTKESLCIFTHSSFLLRAGSNLVGYMRCSSDAQKRLQQSLTAGALTGLSMIPGAIPALGNTMLAVISGQAASAISAAAGGGGSGARAASGSGSQSTSAATAPSVPVDPMTASPFATVGEEKVTI